MNKIYRHLTGRRQRLTLAAAVGLTVMGYSLFANPGHSIKASEYDVKAAFLVSFAQFISWPEAAENTDKPFQIGIVGEDPFGEILDQIASRKSFKGRPIVISRFEASDTPRQCDMVFVNLPPEDAKRFCMSAGKTPCVTIGDADMFLKHGGIIQFVMDENRVRFDINLAAAQQAGLEFQARLLRLAREVYDKEP